MLSPLSRIWPTLRLSSGASFLANVTSTASSITRFMNSSKPCVVVSAVLCVKSVGRGRGRTLSLPSMRSPRFSYSQTEMVARDCSSLKMKLIGGRRTVGALVAVAVGVSVSVQAYLFLRRDLGMISARGVYLGAILTSASVHDGVACAVNVACVGGGVVGAVDAVDAVAVWYGWGAAEVKLEQFGRSNVKLGTNGPECASATATACLQHRTIPPAYPPPSPTPTVPLFAPPPPRLSLCT